MHQVIIKVCQEKDLPILENAFKPDFQKPRFGIQQSGDGLYLIAWDKNTPLGHLFIKYFTPVSHLKDQDIYAPYLEALEVKEEYREHGVATNLLEEAEKILKEKGYKKVGLSVGINNDTAYKLYEHLGYTEQDLGQYLVSWEYKDEEGNMSVYQEECVYMNKVL